MRHTHENGEPLSTAVASAVAAAGDTAPTETSWTLTDSIDPEALDALFDQYRATGGGFWRFEFDVGRYRVVVENDGVISVYRVPK
jgi:hypothetical protein